MSGPIADTEIVAASRVLVSWCELRFQRVRCRPRARASTRPSTSPSMAAISRYTSVVSPL